MGQEEFTTAQVLDNSFGAYISNARLWLSCGDGEPRLFGDQKKRFVSDLERALAGMAPESEGVTYEHLQQMIELANGGNWYDVSIIRALHERYAEIRQKPFDMEKLFPSPKPGKVPDGDTFYPIFRSY